MIEDSAAQTSTTSSNSSGFQASWYFLPHDNKTQKNDKKVPCLRWGHATILAEKSLYIYGGTGLVKHSRQWENIYQLNLETWDWTRLDSNNQPPAPLDSHSGVIYQNKLYLFGGNNKIVCQNTLYEYDLITNMWKVVEAKGTPPSPREGHCCCLFNDKYLGIYGGWNGEDTFDDFHILDLQKLTWLPIEKETGTRPSPRESQSCCTLRGSIYLFGGQGNNIVKDGQKYENFFNDLFKLNVNIQDDKAIISWEDVYPKGLLPSKRASHSSCVYKDRYMFVLAGEGYPPDFDEDFSGQKQGKNFQRNQTKRAAIGEESEDFDCYPKNDVWYYDIEPNQWFRLSIKNEIEFAPRFVHKSEVYKDCLIVFGGLRDYHHSANDVSVLSLLGVDPFETAKGHLELMVVPKPSDKADGKSPEKENTKDRIESITESQIRYLKSTNTDDDFKYIQPKPQEEKVSQVPIIKTIEISKRVNKEDVEKTALKLQTTVVSMSFIHYVTNLITWPFAAFGMFVDNALINKASSLKINHVKNSGMQSSDDNDSKTGQKKKNQKDEEVKGDERLSSDTNSRSTSTSLVNPYIVIEDNGKGWKHQDFLSILLNYDIDCPESIVPDDGSEENFVPEDDRKKRINEYGFNLKASGFRLGRTLVFVTKYEDEISLGLLSVDKRINPNIHRNQVFYCAWRKSTGQYLTKHPQKYKSVILNALSDILSEDELIKSLDKISTKIFILDLNPSPSFKGVSSKSESLELIYTKKVSGYGSDIRIRQVGNDLKKLNEELPIMLIDLSLRTYLSYFFLDSSKVGLEIVLNDTVIKPSNIKKASEQKAEQGGSIRIQSEDLFDGILVNLRRLTDLAMKKELASKNEKQLPKIIKEPSKNEELNQGVLLYYDNRLIRRLENPKFGNLDFLLPLLQNPDDLQKPELFDIYGYLDLKNYFKPNLSKTEIENIYYSNYLYTEMMGKIEELRSMAGKRKIQESEDDLEGESALKKVKQT